MVQTDTLQFLISVALAYTKLQANTFTFDKKHACLKGPCCVEIHTVWRNEPKVLPVRVQAYGRVRGIMLLCSVMAWTV